MPAGLRVRDPSTGRVKIDTSTIIGNVLSIVSLDSSSPQSGSVYVGPLLQEGTPFYFLAVNPVNTTRDNIYPTFSFNGPYFQWSYPNATIRPPYRILIGIY